MKRTILIVITVILLLVLCGCAAPSSAQVRKLVPQTVDVDPAHYPLLHQAPPTLYEILGDTPRTFTFDESEWTPTETEYTKYGYDTYTNTKGEILLYDDGMQIYTVSHGSINPDLTIPEDYYSIEYSESGELISYTDSKYGYYALGESTEIYEEVDGEDVLIESSTSSQIYVKQEDADYNYLVNNETMQIESIDVSQMNFESQYKYDYFTFNYTPGDGSVTNVTMQFSVKGGDYSCYYDDNGNLLRIVYTPANQMEVYYEYDKNYERIN